jgi:hypothetical protein
VAQRLDGTFRWDAGWFVRIAEKGYDPDDGSAEFYPAFPLVSRAFAWLLPIGALAATLVSNVSFLLALILLYGLTTLEYSENVARRSVVLLATFPASFVFMAPYSESLFLLSSVATFWWARRGRWRTAAIAGVIATATRAVGLVLIPPLLIEATKEGDPSRRGWRIVAALVPAAGFVAYLAYWLVRSGNPLQPLQAPALWQRTTQVPFSMIGRGIVLGLLGVGDTQGRYWTADLLLTGTIVGPLLVGWRSLRISYVVYAACYVRDPVHIHLSAETIRRGPTVCGGDVSRVLDLGSEAAISCIRRRDGHIRSRLRDRGRRLHEPGVPLLKPGH